MTPLVATAGRAFSVVANSLMVAAYLAGAVAALWPGVFDFNVAIRGGIAAFFLGRAALSVMSAVARFHGGSTHVDQIARGYLFLSYGYIAAGVLVGVGALWYGGILGFLVAYAAFSIAWLWFWFKKTLASDQAGERSEAAAP